MEASPFKTSPLKTGRLSLLSSDIEEESDLLDLDDPQFDFVAKDEFYLLETPAEEIKSYEIIAEWLSSVFPHKDVDPYFNVPALNTTPCKFVAKCLGFVFST